MDFKTLLLKIRTSLPKMQLYGPNCEVPILIDGIVSPQSFLVRNSPVTLLQTTGAIPIPRNLHP